MLSLRSQQKEQLLPNTNTRNRPFKAQFANFMLEYKRLPSFILNFIKETFFKILNLLKPEIKEEIKSEHPEAYSIEQVCDKMIPYM